MISLQTMRIALGEKNERIERFEVWFQSPMGLHKELDNAINVCDLKEIDPVHGIRAVAVAIGETLTEVIG